MKIPVLYSSFNIEELRFIIKNLHMPPEEISEHLRGRHKISTIKSIVKRLNEFLMTGDYTNAYDIEVELLSWYLDDNTIAKERTDINDKNLSSIRFVDKKIFKGLTKRDIEKYYKIFSNPVRWAEHILRDPKNPNKPLRLRPWQKEVLMAMKLNDKVSLRIARRCGKSVTLAVFSLWKASTTEAVNIVLITPYESQVRVLWEMIGNMIHDSDIISSSITVFRRRSPYEIKFKNGSTIRGFTTAERSTKGTTVRGADADIMILDEVDYMSDETLGAILALTSGAEQMQLIVSSTPSGKRGFFYDTQTKPELGFWVKHLTVHEANPNWSRERDLFYRKLHAKNPWIYEREYLASFSDEVEGVFSHKFIDAAIKKYSYRDIIPKKESIYIIGIDWNTPQNGDRIVVLERDNKKKKFRVVAHEIVMEERYKNQESMKRIIALYDKFRPKYIYVDKGYGDVAVEDLMLLSKQRGMDLHKKLVIIDFSKPVEIWSPTRKILVKKHPKPLMVDFLARVLAENILEIPEEENEIGRIVDELREFKRKKSTSHIPVFEDENCHSVTALMLAVYGYMDNFSIFSPRHRTGMVNPFKTLRFRYIDSDSEVDREINTAESSTLIPGVEKRGPMMKDIVEEEGIYDYEYRIDPGPDSKKRNYDSFDEILHDKHKNNIFRKRNFVGRRRIRRSFRRF